MTARGWLIDLYVREDIIVLWFRLQSGTLLCLTDSFPYRFYAQGHPRELLALEKNLSYLIRRTNWTKRRDFWTGKLIPSWNSKPFPLRSYLKSKRFSPASLERSAFITLTWPSPSIMPI